MAARLTAVELRRSQDAGELTVLSADKVALLKQKLFSEKAAILAEFEKSNPLRAMAAKRKTGVWISSGIAALLLLGVGIVLLRNPSAAVETRIVFVKGDVQVAESSAKTGAVTKTGSPITTGAVSLTVLKQGKYVATAIAQNTRLTIRSVASDSGRPHFELENLNGLVFCSVEKGQAMVTVKTPTGKIHVIGTSFSIDAGPLGTNVAVLEGTVEVQPGNAPAQTKQVSAGTRLQISQKSGPATSQQLLPAETQALNNFQKLTALGGAENRKDTQEDEINELSEKVLKTEKILRHKSTPAKLTLADIRKKYGKISQVTLTNGTSYIGFFSLNGDQMSIITANGTVVVPSVQLKDIRRAD